MKLNVVKDNSKEAMNAMEKAVEAALEAIGLQAESYAKLELENSPRRLDTGLLRNSITHAISGKAPAITSYRATNKSKYGSKSEGKTGSYSGSAPSEGLFGKKAVYIGTNVEYAEYVHDGTMKMSPNRFLKNAVVKNSSQYKEIAEAIMKRFSV